ncbi:MAG TPA: OmpA family protein [Fibrobacteria bacterium]|nr:OmpA family protein [Fibrobacteria bacterium]
MRALFPALLPGLIPAFFAAALAEPDAGSGRSSASFPDEYGLSGVFETHSSRPVPPGFMVFGASNRTASGLSMVEGGAITGAAGERRLQEAAVASFRGFLTSGLGFGCDLSLTVPWYYESLLGAQTESDAWSLGDVSAILKARLPWEIPFASLSLFATASFPTSSSAPAGGTVLPKQLAYHPAADRYPDPVAHPAGLGKPRAGLGAGITFDLSGAMEGPRVQLHANLSGERTLADGSLDPLLSMAASAAAEAFLTEGLRLEAEFRAQRLAADFGGLSSPLAQATTLGAGLGWMTPLGLSMRVGGVAAPLAWNPYRPLAYESGQGPSSLRYRLQPTLAGFFQIAWQGFPLGRDRDKDGVPDGRDGCPTTAEDRDGFQDQDGCPDADNDGDEVPDAADGCPYTPEDHDGFADGDGCPEPDNDQDGLLDASDRCPGDAEDLDGYRDQDGCPDLDDDQDGIPDSLDKCPRSAENLNGIEDGDGCPEIDTDGDGIPDSRDKCPTEDEIVNFFQDGDGCPDEKPEPVRDAILAGVEFQDGGSELAPASFPVLDALAARLTAYPGTEIEIQAHADDRSGAGAKALTQARAEAVAEYLESLGVESRRMKPVGYGAAKPAQSNRTAQGRSANRRIQIHRLN